MSQPTERSSAALWRAIAALAWPVALARLGIMGMGLVDVMVVGQIAPRELSHQALGWAPIGVLMVTGIGLLNGVQVYTARVMGEGRPELALSVWRRGMVIAVASGLACCAVAAALGEQIYTVFGIAPELARPAARVMRVLLLSVPFHLAYVASAFFLEAIQRPMASTTIMWGANGANLVLNLVLVPHFGAVGSAWATVGARGALALALIAWIWRMPEAARLDGHSDAPGPSYGELLRVGLAAALSQAAEAGAFSGMTMLAGRLGERAVAGYQIVLNFTAVVFMLSLGVASATAVLTSEAEGRRAYQQASRASFMGLGLNTTLMVAITLLVALFPALLARAYTADAELAPMLTGLFPLTALALSPDGAQTVAASALRARNDNWFPTVSHLLAYALVMPVLGYWFAETLGRGVLGLVWAVILSSLLSAAVLCFRLVQLARRARG